MGSCAWPAPIGGGRSPRPIVPRASPRRAEAAPGAAAPAPHSSCACPIKDPPLTASAGACPLLTDSGTHCAARLDTTAPCDRGWAAFNPLESSQSSSFTPRGSRSRRATGRTTSPLHQVRQHEPGWPSCKDRSSKSDCQCKRRVYIQIYARAHSHDAERAPRKRSETTKLERGLKVSAPAVAPRLANRLDHHRTLGQPVPPAAPRPQRRATSSASTQTHTLHV